MNKVKAANEQTTIKVLRTAYFIAMKNRPFSDHDVITINLGNIFHSRYLANTMKKEFVSKIAK